MYARRLFGDDRIAAWSTQIPAGARVAVVAKNAALAYPFLLATPRVHVRVVSPDTLSDMEHLKTLAPDFLAYLDCAPASLPPGAANTALWQANTAVAHFPGALVRIKLDWMH